MYKTFLYEVEELVSVTALVYIFCRRLNSYLYLQDYQATPPRPVQKMTVFNPNIIF